MFTFQQRQSSSRSHARSNGAGGIVSREPLSIDRIRAVAPSVFADGKHDSRSEKYTYVPTSQIVDWMTKNGYGVYAASQSGSRDETKRGHTKHMLRFRHANAAPLVNVGDTRAEMVLVNSHDGSSAWDLMAGLFRLACTNGLIVSAGTLSNVRIPHKGDILQLVANGVESLANQLPMIGHSVAEMARIELSRPEAEIFARAALTVKYDDQPPVTEGQVLAVRRHEDAAPTLWNTLNRVQESLVKGGDRYRLEVECEGRRTVQRRQTQPVNSVDGQTRVNRAIWQLAEEMRKIKG